MGSEMCIRDSTMAGGNGLQFGVALRGSDVWHSVLAAPPVGTRFPAHAAAPVLGAIGDSAVLDFCGLGGQALAFAPALAEEWQEILPGDALQRRQVIVDAQSGAVDPARVRATGRTPIVHLAMLDKSGAGGLIGRGFYTAPAELFNLLPEGTA